MPNTDTPSSRAVMTEPETDLGEDLVVYTPKRDQGGSMTGKGHIFGPSQDTVVSKNQWLFRQPGRGVGAMESYAKLSEGEID